MKDRSLEAIKNDLSIIKSNRLSLSQSKLLFMGVLYEILLRTDVFPKNSDLKSFIEDILNGYTKNNGIFREYIYRSRTLLASRILRDIFDELEYTQIIDITYKIEKIFESSIETKKNTSKVKNNDSVKEWMQFLSK